MHVYVCYVSTYMFCVSTTAGTVSIQMCTLTSNERLYWALEEILESIVITARMITRMCVYSLSHSTKLTSFLASTTLF